MDINFEFASPHDWQEIMPLSVWLVENISTHLAAHGFHIPADSLNVDYDVENGIVQRYFTIKSDNPFVARAVFAQFQEKSNSDETITGR